MKSFRIFSFILSIIASIFRSEKKRKEEVKSGTQKKVDVKEELKNTIDDINDLSTGGQKETLDRINEPADRFIDSTVDLINAIEGK